MEHDPEASRRTRITWKSALVALTGAGVVTLVAVSITMNLQVGDIYNTVEVIDDKVNSANQSIAAVRNEEAQATITKSNIPAQQSAPQEDQPVPGSVPQDPEPVLASAQPVILNDDPLLLDNYGSYDWWLPDADVYGEGYGDNGFWFTVAFGDSDTTDSWAVWDFGAVEGTYEIEAHIPADWATAHVQYDIWTDRLGDSESDEDDYVGGPRINQENVSGWQSLGTFDLQGPTRIEMHDARTLDDWRRDGNVRTRMAADAIRLIKVD